MLDELVPADAVAAHEAGHVVVALSLGIRPLGVELVLRGTSPARTKFQDDALPSVIGVHRATLALSGIAGQLVAGVTWKPSHAKGDIAWLLSGEDPGDIESRAAASHVLRSELDLFELVRARVEAGLLAGETWIPLEQLLARD